MYSFDVIGSLVVDSSGNKEAFFQFMQDVLQGEEYRDVSQYVRSNFATLRARAELMAQRNCQMEGRELYNLEELYEILSLSAVMASEVLDRLKQLECNLYVEYAIGIDANIVVAEQLLEQGETVFFVADTIYSQEVCKRILKKCSPLFEQCECYCASEFLKSQKTGALFWKINQVAKVKRIDWIYYSANRQHCESAQKVGLTVNVLKYSMIPEIIDTNIGTSDYAVGKMIELTRSAILDATDEKQEIGCRIGAPILLPYVEWVLRCARELNIKRLFFVARDGYILKKIADRLIKCRGERIETYYIYGSRKAWRMPSFGKENDNLVELLKWSHVETVKTYGDLAEIFELSVQELRDFIQINNDVTAEKNISKAALAYCISKLKHNETFKQYLMNKNVEKREILKEYLGQFIQENQVQMAFVELAGGGYTQESLASVLRELGITEVINFYFKMDSIRRNQKCKNYVFWFNNMKNSAIIETLCHAAEGQTYGYKRCGNQIIPLQMDDEGEALGIYGYEQYVGGILLFVEQYLKYLDGLLLQVNCMNLVTEYMRVIGECPDKQLLLFIAKMPFEVTGRERDILEYAPVLTENQIQEYYVHRQRHLDNYKGGFLEYSLLRTALEKTEMVQKYVGKQSSLQNNAESEKEEFYPMEFVKEDAIIIVNSKEDDSIYKFIEEQKPTVQFLRYDKIDEMKNNLKKNSQIVLGMYDIEVLDQTKQQLEKIGISSEKILAIDLKPKYTIGK